MSGRCAQGQGVCSSPAEVKLVVALKGSSRDAFEVLSGSAVYTDYSSDQDYWSVCSAQADRSDPR